MPDPWRSALLTTSSSRPLLAAARHPPVLNYISFNGNHVALHPNCQICCSSLVNEAVSSQQIRKLCTHHKHIPLGDFASSITPKRPPSMDEEDVDQTLIARSHKRSGSFELATDPKAEDDKNDLGALRVEDAIEIIGFGTFQAFALVYAGMAWVADAMEMMLLSFVGPAVQKYWDLSAAEESMITSVVFIGMMFGAFFWGALSDLKGRRSGFLFTAMLTFGAGILSAFSTNYYALLLLRGLVGVGLAGGSVITSWFLEFIPTHGRGLWMVLTSVFWTIGTVAEALLAWAVMPTLGWRWLLGLSSIPLLVLLVFYPFVPESPRYLVSKGKTDEARAVLQNMARINQSTLCIGELSIGELSQENGIIVQEVQTKQMVHEAFRLFWTLFSPSMVRSTLLLWLIFFANAFTYYGLVLLTSQLSGGAVNCNAVVDASSTTVNSGYEEVLVTSFAELPGLILSAAIVDRYGRKNSMAALFLLCGAFLLPLVQPLAGNMTTLLLFGARACITGTFTIVFIYAPEVYPTQLRATGLGTANSFARIGGVLCPLVAVDLVKSCQLSLAVTLFVIVPVLGSIAVFFLPIETKGRLLTDTVDESNLSI